MPTYKDVGGSQSFLSPEQVTSRRKMAQAMIGKGTDTSPVGHWTQALARVVQGGIGGYSQDSADQGERDGRRDVNARLTKALTSKAPLSETATSLMGNPWSEETGQDLAVSSMKQDAKLAADDPQKDYRARDAQWRSMGYTERDPGYKEWILTNKLPSASATSPNVTEIYDEATGQPRKVILGADGTTTPLGGVKSNNGGQGNAPSGYRWSATKPGEMEAIAGGPASKLPADVAGKVGMMRVAIGNLPTIRNIFLGEESDIDPKTGKPTRKGANIGMIDYYATKGNIGEGIRLTTGAIESVLRAASGAAVPEQEVTRYQSLFMPSPYDTEATKARKVDALENWIGTMLSAIQEGRPVALDEAHRAAQSGGGVAPQQSQAPVPEDAVRELLADPSPEARREFEEAFGVPADQFLQGQ
jgi:hypothetical protein